MKKVLVFGLITIIPLCICVDVSEAKDKQTQSSNTSSKEKDIRTVESTGVNAFNKPFKIADNYFKNIRFFEKKVDERYSKVQKEIAK